jgi:hypothetical protein
MYLSAKMENVTSLVVFALVCLAIYFIFVNPDSPLNPFKCITAPTSSSALKSPVCLGLDAVGLTKLGSIVSKNVSAMTKAAQDAGLAEKTAAVGESETAAVVEGEEELMGLFRA